MKLFYGLTTLKADQYFEYYKAIHSFLISEGHTLTRDWFPNLERKIIGKENVKDSSYRYEKTIKAIYEAKALIIEDTVSNFSTGHMITLGIQRNIPILVLHIKNKKDGIFKKGMLHGIKSDYLQISEYTLKNYKDIIKAFIKKYEEHYKRTFSGTVIL